MSHLEGKRLSLLIEELVVDNELQRIKGLYQYFDNDVNLLLNEVIPLACKHGKVNILSFADGALSANNYIDQVWQQKKKEWITLAKDNPEIEEYFQKFWC